MPSMSKSLFWARTDTAGSEHAQLDDARGLIATGVAQAVDPIPYTCRYDLGTDETWATVRLTVEANGAGWSRSVRLERSGPDWRVTTTEQGDLDAAQLAAGHPAASLPGTDDPGRLSPAIDVDLNGSPLFNTLPVRRLGLHRAEPGTEHRVTVAWVLLPSLVVTPAEQVYTALGAGRVRFTSGSFTAEVEFDADGYVRHYPGLAERAEPR